MLKLLNYAFTFFFGFAAISRSALIFSNNAAAEFFPEINSGSAHAIPPSTHYERFLPKYSALNDSPAIARLLHAIRFGLHKTNFIFDYSAPPNPVQPLLPIGVI